jgi:uncharacterized protein YhfF
VSREGLRPALFAHPGPLRDRLVAAILAGEKTSTSSLLAGDEGEGFETVAQWREAHERFWSGRETGDDTRVVTERFRLVERLN